MEIDSREKNHLLSNCCIATKKRSRVFTIFPETFFVFFVLFQVLRVMGSIDNPANGNWN